VTFIGAITAFFAATVGLVQNDIKRVIAYSTCSQLGYMFVALGVGAYSAASSTCSRTPSSRRCCSSAPARSSTPCTTSRTCARWAAAPARSRHLLDDDDRHAGADRLPARPPASSPRTRSSRRPSPAHTPGAGYAFWLRSIAALLTSFYSWRLIFMTFHGKPRAIRPCTTCTRARR
jgi:NADH-quinone oxidoreductase subunit L